MLDLSTIYPQTRYRTMPLTSEKNKTLYCLRCGGKDDEIRKYGWLWCGDCYKYVELTRFSPSYNLEEIYARVKERERNVNLSINLCEINVR